MQNEIFPELDFSDTFGVFNWLYSTEGTDKAFSISYDERQRCKFANKDFTYGEIDYNTFIDLMNRAGAKEGEVFYDLGCGAGKAVVVSALAYPLSKVRGVELLEGLYKLSKGVCEKMKSLPGYNAKSDVDIVNDDFLNVDFSDADIVYISSTCFSEDTMEKLEKKFLNLKSGSRIIMLTKDLNSSDFDLKYKELCKMGWGTCTVRLYVRN